jgi:hypothetical protein
MTLRLPPGCEAFVHKSWPRLLNAFARRLNPILPRVKAAGYGDYYWVLDQAEIATDVMFKTRADLKAVWPDLVRHATLALSSEDVLGFLGRKLHPSLAAEVVTDGKRRQEGWRVKHRMGQNWLKVYDKVSVLRAETVINKPSEFRILPMVTNVQGRRERRWCQMRKGVSDMWRFYQVGMAANHRYLDALADAPLQGEGVAALDALCRPRTKTAEPTPGSVPSHPPTSRCSERSWLVNTPSAASATPTLPAASTPGRPSTPSKLTDDASVCRD